jgi:putative addiction module component
MAILTADEIVRLSPSERLALIAELWDSLEQHDLPLSEAQETAWPRVSKTAAAA